MKKLININLKQKFALVACVILFFILCRPLIQLVTFENARRFSEPDVLLSTMEQFFLPGIITDLIPTLASSGIIALVFFSYLFSKKRVDLYHSIPVDRKKLFAVNYISGVIVYIIGLIVEYVICSLIAIPNHYMTVNALYNILAALAVNLVHFLFGYSITIFSIMLTGNIIVAVMGAVTISLFQPVIVSLLSYFSSSMYVTHTNCSSVKEDLLTKYYWLSPLSSYGTIIERLTNQWDIRTYAVNMKRISDISGTSSATSVELVYKALVMPLVISVIFAILAYCLYLKRPSESAGKTIAFKKSQPFIRIPIVITGGLIGAWFMMISINGFRTNWIWLGLVLGVLLSHCVLEIIFNESFKALFSDKIQLIVSLVAAMLVIGVFYGDITGYDKFIPKRERIKSAAVFFDGIDTNLSCITVNEDPKNPGSFTTSYDGSMSYSFLRQFTNDILIDKIYAISQIGVSCVDDMISSQYENGNDEIMYAKAYGENWAVEDYSEDAITKPLSNDMASLSDDETYNLATKWMKENGIIEQEHETDDRKISINICYTLNNGKVVLRRYDIPLSKVLKAMNEVYKSEEYNRNHFDVYDAIEKDAIYKVEVFDVLESRVMTFTDADCKKFIDVYMEDLSNLTIDKISEYPVGRITPYFKNSSGYDEIFNGYYIYPSFNKTLTYLENIGINTDDFTSDIDPKKVQSIYVNSYSLYRYENGDSLFLDDLVYTADENWDMIKELAPKMVNSYNMWSNEILYNKSIEGTGVDVTVYFTSDKGLQKQAIVQFKDGKVPEKLKQDIAVGIWKNNNY